MSVYRAIDPSIKHHRGLLTLLRKRPEKLTTAQINKRDYYFQRLPALYPIYEFHQELYQLLMKKTLQKKTCQWLIPKFLRMIEKLKHSGFKPLVTLGNTLYQWREEIVRMWRFTKNNGITEGFHRKMKLIQRRAYGFRNFENYRLRVKVLCS